MASCRKFKSLIDLYLDGEADDRQAETLLSHIEGCEGCRDRFEEAKSLHRAIKSVPTVKLPSGFRRAIMAHTSGTGIPACDSEEVRHRFPWSVSLGWAGAAAAILLLFALTLYIYSPEPALAASEIHIVSPLEDAVIEQQYVDISVAFTSGGARNIRVILDSKDVTSATEINEDFLIYTSDTLQSGYHMTTVQVMDDRGIPIAQRSWAFYII